MRLRTQVLAATAFAMLVASFGAFASIRRTPGSWVFGPDTAFSDGTTGNLFIPLSEPIASAGLLNARFSTELVASSGGCRIKPALRWSEDGIGWGTPATDAAFGWRTAVGIDYGTAYSDLTTIGTPKPWVQFGVFVANAGGNSRVEVCKAAIMVEPKERVR